MSTEGTDDEARGRFLGTLTDTLGARWSGAYEAIAPFRVLGDVSTWNLAANVHHSPGAAATARANLIAISGWTIDGAGPTH